MSWHLSLENIAGIRNGAANLEPGVNAVRASNWQGKSSFLAGIETAFGTATPLTEGQSTGRVVLTTDDETVTVDLTRSNGSVTRSGEPYLDDEYDRVCASLFAFLDEDNEIRRAVRNGENLESLLTRPLDLENIDERIADRRTERNRIEAELERAEAAAERLPAVQERVTKLESKVEGLREERERLEDEATGDDETRERLSELRAEREQVTTRVERLETTRARIKETLQEKRAELDSLTVPDDDTIESELERRHTELREIERDEELLQSVYESNKRVLDENRTELLTDVSHEMLADSVQCWLCGESVTRDDLEAQLDVLADRVAEYRSRASDLAEDVDELEAKRDEIAQQRRRKRDLEDHVGDLESRLAETEESLETARDRHADLESRIEDLADSVETTEDRLTDLQSDIKYTEAELEDAREELEETERLADQRAQLDDEYESVTDEITALRNRKDAVKRRMREAFSAALDELLETFDTGFETARLTGTFDLVVARDGREAHLDALSEGEQELLGFVAALAGHEAFDVGERVPVILLDGLGGLASDNLTRLVDFVAERADYLVLTAYPEHDEFDGHELSPAEWQVVSTGPDAEAPS